MQKLSFVEAYENFGFFFYKWYLRMMMGSDPHDEKHFSNSNLLSFVKHSAPL